MSTFVDLTVEFDPRDWLIKTVVLSHEERGVYSQLLCCAVAWDGGACRLPDDDEMIARLLRLQTRRWQRIKQTLLDPNFHLLRSEGGYLTNDWLTETRKALSRVERPSITEWRDLKETVFRRDNYTCQYCGARGARLECDHIVPLSRGGTNDLDNLATACVTCNRSKGGKLLEEWRPPA